MPDRLVPPHGGALAELLADARRAAELRAVSRDGPSWTLTPRQSADLELLLTGGFSPLRGFLTRADHEAVCGSMRLTSGILWPVPVTLDVPTELARTLRAGDPLALRDPEGVLLAVLHVEDVWQRDPVAEAETVYGTASREHPGVVDLLEQAHPCLVGGPVEGVQLPIHYDFRPLRTTPRELRAEFARLGWRRVLAFQTESPLHRAQYELTFTAAREAEANLLIHPSVGAVAPSERAHYARMRCYQAILPRYPQQTVKLAILPLAWRLAGPREALWHAIIEKNYGCTHFLVAREHADPGGEAGGKPFYAPTAAQDLLREHEGELGVRQVAPPPMVYVEDADAYLPEDEVPPGARVLSLSGAELRERLARGRDLPPWVTFPEIARELERSQPPRHRQGLTVFFTGLSGAGKSTIANVLRVKLLEMGGRPVTLLDGDIVRKHLSSELGFSKEHRDINIRRIGFVAAEITKNGGIAICAPIAPYDGLRRRVREMISPLGGFVLVHVATPLHVCEQRDRKGLYARARAGRLPEFTGIGDPYEPPRDADVVLDTTDMTPEEGAQEILLHLEREGYVAADGP